MIEEILKCKSSLIPKSGLREQFFFAYLTKTDNIFNEIPTNELDKICYAAFIDPRVDVSREIQCSINNTPVKGMHFSANLILLIAFALKSNEAKSNYLKNYFSSCSLMDQFFINKVFPEYTLPDNTEIRNEFEQLIKECFIDKNYKGIDALLYSAFEKVNDLNELYVVRSAQEELIKLHPSYYIIEKYNILNDEFQKSISVNEKRINVFVNTVIIVITIGLIFFIPYIVVTKWIDWNLEPYFTGLPITIAIALFIIFIVFGWSINLRKLSRRFLQKVKYWLLKKFFSINKIDLDKVKDNLRNDKDVY